MNAEEALKIAEEALGEERLSKLQMAIFRQTWNDLSYQEIAKSSGYEVGYIKQIGSQLWQILSQVLGEKVSKGTLHSAVKRYVTKRASAEGWWGVGEPQSQRCLIQILFHCRL